MRKNLYRKAGALWIGARRLGKDRFGYRNTRASLDQPEGTQRDIRYPSRLSNTQGFIIIHRDHQCHPSATYRCFLKSTRNQQGSTYESASMADFVEYSWNCLHFPWNNSTSFISFRELSDMIHSRPFLMAISRAHCRLMPSHPRVSSRHRHIGADVRD